MKRHEMNEYGRQNSSIVVGQFVTTDESGAEKRLVNEATRTG